MLNRDALLTYRNNNEFLPNTALHEAILDNNSALAGRYVELDKEGFIEDGRSIINERSGGNTPLLLALKRGDMDTALAILSHPQVDISVADNNNLTALHWACMLRQDEVIEVLIERGADPASAWIFENEREPLRKTTQELYEHQIDSEKLRRYFELGRSNAELFIDQRGYKILGEECYTDIIFHMRELCRNLNWVNRARFKADNDEEIRRESDLFRYNFGQGTEDFSHSHNIIPVNRAILALLHTSAYSATPISDSLDKPINDEQQFYRDNESSSASSPSAFIHNASLHFWQSSPPLSEENEAIAETPSITNLLNHHATTALEHHQTWSVEETSHGYKLYCDFQPDADSAVNVRQIYSNARAHIQALLPTSVESLAAEEKENSVLSQDEETTGKIAIAEFSRTQWDEFVRRLTSLDNPARIVLR